MGSSSTTVTARGGGEILVMDGVTVIRGALLVPRTTASTLGGSQAPSRPWGDRAAPTAHQGESWRQATASPHSARPAGERHESADAHQDSTHRVNSIDYEYSPRFRAGQALIVPQVKSAQSVPSLPSAPAPPGPPGPAHPLMIIARPP